jgi:hypothetical protein
MQVWDAVLIKPDSNHPKKGRAGVIQGVTYDQNGRDVAKVSIRLDETAKGDQSEIVSADVADVQRL